MNCIFRISTICFLTLATYSAWSQLPLGNYKDYEDHFLHLENDSFVNYQLLIGVQGSVSYTQAGIGVYETFCDTILIWTIDSLLIEEPEYEMIYKWDTSSISKESPCKIFTFEFVTETEIVLTGPILNDYENMNRKKFRRGFLNWPWKWSFKKEHWYDPGGIVLIKE